MSDEEYEYEYGSDAEYNYGSDGGDGADPENEIAIEIENSFYEAVIAISISLDSILY
jgi:hypothetical protein